MTSVTALGPPSESCDGACLDVAQYIWNTTSGALDLKATQDPSGKFLTRTFNSNGLPTKITYGDVDSDPTNSNSIREVYLYYSDPSFPGLVTETRRKSELNASASSCSSTNTTGCARTITTYDANGKVWTVQEIGDTLANTGGVRTYDFTTTYTYDSSGKGRLAQIDGPLSGSNDVTVFEYWSSTNPLKDGFLQNLKRKKDTTSYVTQSSLEFDFWGNATALVDADGTLSCQTFSASRGHLTERRETMAGQTSCTSNAADLVTSYVRDAALRLTRLTRPDGSCVFYTYESKGRLETERRRDDCNAGSLGDTKQYTYSSDGQLAKIELFDANGDVKKRQEMTYFDSRRLEKVLNPVNPAKWTGRTYDPRGMLEDITAFDGATSLSKTQWSYTADGRVDQEKRYTVGTAFDTWSLLFDWIGNQKQVTDGDAKVTKSVRDDLGRLVKLESPDMGSFPTIRVYDDANRLTTIVETLGGANPQTHNFAFDNLGRLLDANYHGACYTSGGPTHSEIQRVFDAPPTGTCPAGMTCSNTAGRLAHVKVTLLCPTTYLGSDGALDQETWYAYDAAGRVIREYIKDDSTRVADHQFAWTKNGALQQTTTPSGAVIGSTYGSGGNNSDTDRITALWRTSTATPIIDNILWNPFGPLKKYNQMNTYAGQPVYTLITRNLAFRTTLLEIETSATELSALTVNEDAKGRVTARLPWPSSVGWQDSYFLYDQQDRVLCETTTSVSSCPTTGSNIKNSHNQTPPFTAAGDWKGVLRPIAGSTCLQNDFSLVTSTHRIYEVSQNDTIPSGCSPSLRTTQYQYDARGNRLSDNNGTLTNDTRTYGYDARRNLTSVVGKYYHSGTWRTYWVQSAFDGRNRRVYKSLLDTSTGKIAEWFFYYDPLDRLIEVRHTPDTSSASSYSVFQLFWLDNRLILYWQTDYPSATTSKRYVGTDESGRPIEMNDWGSSGAWSRVWAINPSAWGADINLVGPSLFQPVLFAGQYKDDEAAAWQNDGTTLHRPGTVLNGFRTYDPFTGSYLQVDPLVDSTWSTYIYANSDPVTHADRTGRASDTGVSMELTFVITGGGGYVWGDCWDSNNTIEVGGCLGGWTEQDGWSWGDWPIGGGGSTPDPFDKTQYCLLWRQNPTNLPRHKEYVEARNKHCANHTEDDRTSIADNREARTCLQEFRNSPDDCRCCCVIQFELDYCKHLRNPSGQDTALKEMRSCLSDKCPKSFSAYGADEPGGGLGTFSLGP